MAKHLENCTKDSTYGEMIARQGVRLVYLENRVKELENQLIQERMDRIEDLQSVKYIARNPNNILQDVLSAVEATLELITGGIIQNKKEKNLHTNHDI